MKLLRNAVMVLSLVVCLSAQAARDEEQIKSQILNYEKALNKSDVNSVLGLYGADPVFMPQGSLAQTGREQIRKAYEGVFKAIQLNIRFSVYEIEVLGTTAWARTSSEGKTKIHATGAMVEEGNNELFVFKKEKDTWKIHRYLFSTNRTRQ